MLRRLPKSKSPDSAKTMSEQTPVVSKKLQVKCLPESSGSFKEHQTDVQSSFIDHAKKYGFTVTDTKNPDNILVIIFQPQGRVGDELPKHLPEKVYGDMKNIILVVVRDDEFGMTDRSCLPRNFNPRLLLDVHVVPGQHQLHSGMRELCDTNQRAFLRMRKEILGKGPIGFDDVLLVGLVIALISCLIFLSVCALMYENPYSVINLPIQFILLILLFYFGYELYFGHQLKTVLLAAVLFFYAQSAMYIVENFMFPEECNKIWIDRSPGNGSEIPTVPVTVA